VNRFILILTLALSPTVALAADEPELLVPFGAGMSEDLPPQLTIPDPAVENDGTTSNHLPTLTSESIVADELPPSLQSFDDSNSLQVLDFEPAALESTGTWLRRGFWFAEVDVVLLDRIWRRDPLILGRQGANELVLNGGRNGAETSPRVKIGRFLFRDSLNRDHTVEFIGYGGGQWSQEGSLNGNSFVVNPSLDLGNPSFDTATSSQFDYNSRFNSFEVNYILSQRMRRDRMELEPSGRWVRRAQISPTWSLLAGLRYFQFSEDFSWQAFGIPDTNADGNTETGDYRIRTDNDLLGPQLGFNWGYDASRWSLGIKAKSGLMLNITDIRSDFSVTGGTIGGSNAIDVDNISFLTEAGIVGKWHLRPNLSLRVGVEMMYISSLAHAPDQINFATVSTSGAASDGDSTYMGGSVGFEGYW